MFKTLTTALNNANNCLFGWDSDWVFVIQSFYWVLNIERFAGNSYFEVLQEFSSPYEVVRAYFSLGYFSYMNTITLQENHL